MKHILYSLIALIASLHCLPIMAEPHSNQKPYVFDDWICDSQNKLCNGYYLEQPALFPGQSQKNLEDQPISITSDQCQLAPEGDSIVTGNVHLIHGNRQSFADKVILHRDTGQTKEFDFIEAIGHVKIIESGLRVDGTRADMDVERETEIIQEAHFRLYARHARGTADTITLLNRNRMILKNASYTTCAPCQDTWVLKANTVDLNQKTGRGRARHTRLYVNDVPIFYFPYIDFPIDDRRQTGFLYPQYSASNRSGVELATPFYWNIAPNYDATFTPKYLSKRGLDLQGLFRYLSNSSMGEMEGGILPNDKAYRHFRAEKNKEVLSLLTATSPGNKITNSFSANPDLLLRDPRVTALNKGGNTRRAFKMQNDTIFNPHLSAAFRYQTVGDDNYFMDLGDTLGMVSTTQLLQQGDVTYQDPNWKFMARLQQYQTLHPFNGPQTFDVYRRLPQLSLQNTFLDLPYGLEWVTTGEFSRFLHRHDHFTDAPFTTGDRLQLRPGLALPITTPGWFIKPRIQLNVLAYSLSLAPIDTRINQSKKPSNIIPIFDLDSGLFFERNFSFWDETYIQTLEPRAYYLYVPYKNQSRLPIFDTTYSGFNFNQLFRDNRFTGLDRVGDANQVTLAVTTRFLSDKQGNEYLSLTLGQIYYFNSRRVTICNPKTDPLCLSRELPNPRNQDLPHSHPSRRRNRTSSYVGMARFYIDEELTTNAEIEWDPYRNCSDKEAISFQYLPSEKTVFNIGYQFLRRNPAKLDLKTGLPKKLSQTDTSLAFEVTEKWRVLGRWHYDVKNRRSNDISFGIEQQGCCTAVRLFVSRFLEPFDDSRTENAQAQALFQRKHYSNAIYLQFVFKGLAGVGHNKITSSIKRAIPGYQWSDKDFGDE